MNPPAWERFDFAVDITGVHDLKIAAVRARKGIRVSILGCIGGQDGTFIPFRALSVYESVFSGEQAGLLDKHNAEDRYDMDGRLLVGNATSERLLEFLEGGAADAA